MNQSRGAVLLILLTSAVLGTTTEVTASTAWEVGVGLGHLAPGSDELPRLNEGGPSFHSTAARRLARPRWLVPTLGPGLQILYPRERFEYRLGEENRVAAERRLSVSGEDYEITGGDGFDAGSFRLRLGWRFP